MKLAKAGVVDGSDWRKGFEEIGFPKRQRPLPPDGSVGQGCGGGRHWPSYDYGHLEEIVVVAGVVGVVVVDDD